MFEEPYRWIDAIRNRRDYVEDQLASGSPVVALPYADGALLATVGGGTPKLYEIYDQIAFGAIGHPADIEKLRSVVLDAAHVEGFSRSPADVTLRRLLKFGLAPALKLAFEEVLHAPFIARIVMAEVNLHSGQPLFVRLNYDGVFEETEAGLALGPTAAATRRMQAYLHAAGDAADRPLAAALQLALRTWAVAQLVAPVKGDTTPAAEPHASGSDLEHEPVPAAAALDAELRPLDRKRFEIGLIDRRQRGSAKYRTPTAAELDAALAGILG